MLFSAFFKCILRRCLELRWPDLLSKFLKMIWCTPISGDDAEGAILVEQRLLPHPDAWIFNDFIRFPSPRRTSRAFRMLEFLDFT